MQSGIGVECNDPRILICLLSFVSPTRTKPYRNQLIFFVALLVFLVGVYLYILLATVKKCTPLLQVKAPLIKMTLRKSPFLSLNSLVKEQEYSMSSVMLKWLTLSVDCVQPGAFDSSIVLCGPQLDRKVRPGQ